MVYVMMKRTIFAVITLCALVVTAFAGCGRTQEEIVESEPLPTEAPAEPTAIAVPDGGGGTMWIEPAENVDPFQLDTSQFSVDGDVITYSGEGFTLQRGIDVSAYQDEIDWQAVAEEDLDFAIIRVGWRGYSGGSLNADDYYRQNIEGALSIGLQVGVYMFSQAVSAEEGAEEAEFVVELLADYADDITLPVFFDWEDVGEPDARTADLDGDTLTAAAKAFASVIEEAGYTPGLYSYLTLYYNSYDLDELSEMTLWAADPGMWPEFYYDHDFWQYSFEGTIAGIDKEVDLDVLFVRDEGYDVIREGAVG